MRAQQEVLVNESIILPDADKHFKEQLQATSKKLRTIIIICAIVSTVSLGFALYLIIHQVVDSQAETLKIANNQLANQNEQLNTTNIRTEEKIRALVDNMVALNTNISKLNNQINETNQEITGLQNYIQFNCDVYHQNIRLNDTNLNAFVMTVPGSAHSKESAPTIADLNLSKNKLTQFCGNALPDLLTIDLSNNPIANISNNRLNSLQSLRLSNIPTLEQFNKNNLPVLTRLDLSNNHLTSFNDNYFPQIQSIQLYRNSLNEISNYSLARLSSLDIQGNPIKILKNNKFSYLTELIGIDNVNLNTVVGNNFGGIQRFFIGCANQTLTFQANTMLKLGNLVLKGCIYEYSKIITNDFQINQSLQIIDSRLNNFQYIPQLGKIQQFSLNSTNITTFSGHKYQNLTYLCLSANTQLALFENNTLPMLENFFISDSVKLQSLSKSDLPNLKHFQSINVGLTDLNCFNDSKSLEIIDVFKHKITSISNFNLPKLTNLKLLEGVIQTFQNNSLPSLECLQIKVNSPEIDMDSFKNTLQILKLSGPLASFSNYNLPSLQSLTLEPQNDIDFKQNILSKLTQLNLKSVSMSKMDQNELGPIERLDIAACLSQQCTLSPKYDSTLKYLTINSSNFKTFMNRELPNLSDLVIVNSALQSFLINKLPNIKQIDLSDNYLISFDCYGISTVESLNLSSNRISDNIATTLLSCTLDSLKYLDLQRNNITNKDQVRSKLAAKFKAEIHI